MAHLRGVEVGKIIRTEADLIEHSYPQLLERNGTRTEVPTASPIMLPKLESTPQTPLAQATPVEVPVVEPPSPKKSPSKKDKAKMKMEISESVEPETKMNNDAAPTEDAVIQTEDSFTESDS